VPSSPYSRRAFLVAVGSGAAIVALAPRANAENRADAELSADNVADARALAEVSLQFLPRLGFSRPAPRAQDVLAAARHHPQLDLHAAVEALTSLTAPSETPLARLSLADRRTRLAARMSSTSDYRDKTVNAFSVTLSAQGWRIPGLTTKCASIGAEAVRIAVARRV
jgi:hypothetical protein